MNHLGTKTLETERLILRAFSTEDAEDMYRNWASDEEVTRYLTWPVHPSVEGTRALLGIWEEKARETDNYHWCMVLKEIQEPIGSIGVVHMNEQISAAEIGYCCGRAFWGKNIMTEAFSAVRDYLFEEVGFNRLEARHDTKNPASGKVMEKCGLRFEGIKRQGDKNNTGICDTAYYAMLREDR